MTDTNKERAILDTAISLLSAEADAVREGVSINGEPDWRNEPTAYAAFQKLSGTAKALFDLAAKAPAAPTQAKQRDELFQASIDFIGTLTGMTPPPIEVAPPEVFAPFYAFVEKVQAITGVAPPAPTEQWIGVTERLPEWVHRDDTPCHINGKEVPPTLTSKTVLVALDGGGVRTDKLTTIEGKSNGWWHTFGERVIAWQDTPAPPQGAAKGAT